MSTACWVSTRNDDLASWVAEDFFRLTFHNKSLLLVGVTLSTWSLSPMGIGDLTVRKLR